MGVQGLRSYLFRTIGVPTANVDVGEVASGNWYQDNDSPRGLVFDAEGLIFFIFEHPGYLGNPIDFCFGGQSLHAKATFIHYFEKFLEENIPICVVFDGPSQNNKKDKLIESSRQIKETNLLISQSILEPALLSKMIFVRQIMCEALQVLSVKYNNKVLIQNSLGEGDLDVVLLAIQLNAYAVVANDFDYVVLLSHAAEIRYIGYTDIHLTNYRSFPVWSYKEDVKSRLSHFDRDICERLATVYRENIFDSAVMNIPRIGEVSFMSTFNFDTNTLELSMTCIDTGKTWIVKRPHIDADTYNILDIVKALDIAKESFPAFASLVGSDYCRQNELATFHSHLGISKSRDLIIPTICMLIRQTKELSLTHLKWEYECVGEEGITWVPFHREDMLALNDALRHYIISNHFEVDIVHGLKIGKVISRDRCLSFYFSTDIWNPHIYSAVRVITCPMDFSFFDRLLHNADQSTKLAHKVHMAMDFFCICRTTQEILFEGFLHMTNTWEMYRDGFLDPVLFNFLRHPNSKISCNRTQELPTSDYYRKPRHHMKTLSELVKTQIVKLLESTLLLARVHHTEELAELKIITIAKHFSGLDNDTQNVLLLLQSFADSPGDVLAVELLRIIEEACCAEGTLRWCDAMVPEEERKAAISSSFHDMTVLDLENNNHVNTVRRRLWGILFVETRESSLPLHLMNDVHDTTFLDLTSLYYVVGCGYGVHWNSKLDDRNFDNLVKAYLICMILKDGRDSTVFTIHSNYDHIKATALSLKTDRLKFDNICVMRSLQTAVQYTHKLLGQMIFLLNYYFDTDTSCLPSYGDLVDGRLLFFVYDLVLYEDWEVVKDQLLFTVAMSEIFHERYHYICMMHENVGRDRYNYEFHIHAPEIEDEYDDDVYHDDNESSADDENDSNNGDESIDHGSAIDDREETRVSQPIQDQMAKKIKACSISGVLESIDPPLHHHIESYRLQKGYNNWHPDFDQRVLYNSDERDDEELVTQPSYGNLLNIVDPCRWYEEFRNKIMSPRPFQLEAYKSIDCGESVVVVAPTGEGKTNVAICAIHKALCHGNRAVIIAPTKSLCNQSYNTLISTIASGPSDFGILTGDSNNNSNARVTVMTPHLALKTLLEMKPATRPLVYIFDEFHNILDAENGYIWEIIVNLMPLQSQFVCLSATLPHSDRICQWFNKFFKQTNLITATVRSVPQDLYIFSRGDLAPLPQNIIKSTESSQEITAHGSKWEKMAANTAAVLFEKDDTYVADYEQGTETQLDYHETLQQYEDAMLLNFDNNGALDGIEQQFVLHVADDEREDFAANNDPNWIVDNFILACDPADKDDQCTIQKMYNERAANNKRYRTIGDIPVDANFDTVAFKSSFEEFLLAGLRMESAANATIANLNILDNGSNSLEAAGAIVLIDIAIRCSMLSKRPKIYFDIIWWCKRIVSNYGNISTILQKYISKCFDIVISYLNTFALHDKHYQDMLVVFSFLQIWNCPSYDMKNITKRLFVKATNEMTLTSQYAHLIGCSVMSDCILEEISILEKIIQHKYDINALSGVIVILTQRLVMSPNTGWIVTRKLLPIILDKFSTNISKQIAVLRIVIMTLLSLYDRESRVETVNNRTINTIRYAIIEVLDISFLTNYRNIVAGVLRLFENLDYLYWIINANSAHGILISELVDGEDMTEYFLQYCLKWNVCHRSIGALVDKIMTLDTSATSVFLFTLKSLCFEMDIMNNKPLHLQRHELISLSFFILEAFHRCVTQRSLQYAPILNDIKLLHRLMVHFKWGKFIRVKLLHVLQDPLSAPISFKELCSESTVIEDIKDSEPADDWEAEYDNAMPTPVSVIIEDAENIADGKSYLKWSSDLIIRQCQRSYALRSMRDDNCHNLLKTLDNKFMTPAIIFTFNIRLAEETALKMRDFYGVNFLSKEESTLIAATIDSFERSKNLKISNSLRQMLLRGFGLHHSGVTSTERSLVQDLLSSGMAKFVFTTSSLAEGVHIPCKTVVFLQDSHQLITPKMFKQCVGRAGRGPNAEKGNIVVTGNFTWNRLCMLNKLQSYLDETFSTSILSPAARFILQSSAHRDTLRLTPLCIHDVNINPIKLENVFSSIVELIDDTTIKLSTTFHYIDFNLRPLFAHLLRITMQNALGDEEIKKHLPEILVNLILWFRPSVMKQRSCLKENLFLNEKLNYPKEFIIDTVLQWNKCVMQRVIQQGSKYDREERQNLQQQYIVSTEIRNVPLLLQRKQLVIERDSAFRIPSAIDATSGNCYGFIARGLNASNMKQMLILPYSFLPLLDFTSCDQLRSMQGFISPLIFDNSLDVDKTRQYVERILLNYNISESKLRNELSIIRKILYSVQDCVNELHYGDISKMLKNTTYRIKKLIEVIEKDKI